ncbi:8627_t:CDS:2, partial [Racocetra persica]
GIGCNKIGCRNINCDATKYHSDDDDSVICPNSLMYFDSDVSCYPELNFSESSTPYLSRGISMSRTSSALSMIFPHFIPFKTEDSTSTILGDYVNVSFKTDDTSITDNIVNEVQSTEIHINPHLHHSDRDFHWFISHGKKLSYIFGEKLYYIFVGLLILFILGYIFGGFNYHIEENFGTGVTKKIDGAVRAQVQEFVEKEMFKISDTKEKNDDDDSDGLVGLVRKQLNEVIHEQLEKMMDGTSADYALYTGGARVIPHLTTRDYEAWPTKSYQILWGILTRKNVIKSNKASIVITPSVNVGECWCFNGTKGQIAIRLSRSIVVTHITYHHIGRQVSIDPISSAPKDFELWGVIDDYEDVVYYENDTEVVENVEKKERKNDVEYSEDFVHFLGEYQYDISGRSAQTFNVPKSIASNNKRVRSIMMKVKSNHENPKFTCLYRLQVH